MKPLVLERLVYLAHIAKRRFPLKSKCPILNTFENIGLDEVVSARNFEDRYEIIDEFSRCSLNKKVVATVLDTRICQAKSK